jgi:hypothetical protein
MNCSGPAVSLSYYLAPPPAPNPFPVSKLDGRHTGRLRKRDNLLTGETGRDGGGAKLYDGEKARSSLNHSIISELENMVSHFVVLVD